MRTTLLLLVAALAGLCCASVRPRFGAMSQAGLRTASFPTYIFHQLVDHSDPHSTETFEQRFYTVMDYWKAPDGPFILSIAGEGPQEGPEGVDDELTVLAKRIGAGVLTLEHRFFGKSMPRPDLSTENLRLLTIEQELEDLANFLRHFQSEINDKFGKTSRNKVVAIGGSYAGMVSSNLRYAHPELVDAAWSSSGVVNAVFNFTDFDLQVGLSMGQKCAEVVRKASEAVEAELVRDNARVKRLFNATGMSDEDLLWMLSDAETLPVQYGHRGWICDPLEAAYEKDQDLVEAFAEYSKSSFYPNFCGDVGAYLYSDKLMLVTDPNTSYAGQRAWWWYVCNQLAYAQAYPGPLGVRSPRVTIEWHKNKCDRVFGQGVWPPNTEAFNRKYGGGHPKATNVFYINGSQDPWQWAGVRRTLSASQPAFVMVGMDVGHCKDLHKAMPDDPRDVVLARLQAEQFIEKALA
eukprot:m51a1_g2674 putative serine carboxypeptidase s28 family protein (463) ;mRNA; f:722701-724551